MNKVTIGTHNGKFHADEIVACVLLRSLPEYKDAEIIRTREASLLDQCSVVVDVGGQFDPKLHRYDHHQREFDLTFSDFFPESKWNIKLSSAGLIFVHFGKRVIASLLDVDVSDAIVPVLFQKLYSSFVVEIDAIDNGVPMTEETPKYSITTNLSSRVARLNPVWNKPDMDEMQCFMRAYSLVSDEFTSILRHYAESWFPARDLVLAAFKNRFNVDSSGHIISLEEKHCPWAAHFFEIEQSELGESKQFDLNDRANVSGRPLFCLYQRSDGTWAFQAIPLHDAYDFKNRLSLPDSWRGLRDAELSDVVGIPECVFVHATGFLGIHKTRDGALHMIRQTLRDNDLLSC